MPHDPIFPIPPKKVAPVMPNISNFTSVEELLDFSWCRDLQWPQVKNMAQVAGLELSDHEFFEGYSSRQAKMERDLPVVSPEERDILASHWD